MKTPMTAHTSLTQILDTLNKMMGEADDRLSQIAGETSDDAKKYALFIAFNAIDEQMETLRNQLTLAYSIATA